MANEFVIKHGFISKGDSIVNGTISGETLNLTTISSNPSLTQVLVRNDTTGVVEYRDASSLSGGSGTNTFVTGFTYNDNNTFTINDNLGSAFTATIDQVSGLTVNGTLSATTLDGNTILSGGTNLLTIIDDRDDFVTGTTFGGNQAILRRNDGTDVFLLSGSSSVQLTNPSSNKIDIDVTIPPGMNTYVTGFTYDDINTFTITDNLGTAFTASINVLSATTISGGTLYGDGSNLTGIPHTTDTFVTGGTYNPVTVNLDFSGNTGFSPFIVDVSALKDDTNTFVTGFTYDNSNTFTITDNTGSAFTSTFNQVSGLTVNGTLSATTLDGNTILSGGTNLITIIDDRDNYVTGTTFSSNQATLTRNDGVDILKISGGTNVTLSNPSSNQIKIDAEQSINTGNVLWVDDVFGNDSTALVDRQDRPWSSIATAIGNAVANDTIMVRPGEYVELDFTLVPSTSLVSQGGAKVTFISASTPTGNFITVSGSSYMEGFTVYTPTDDSAALYFNDPTAGIVTSFHNVHFKGSSTTPGPLGKGLVMDTSLATNGKIIFSELRYAGGNLNVLAEVNKGIFALDGMHVPGGGTINTAVQVNGGRAQMINVNNGNLLCGVALSVSGTSSNKPTVAGFGFNIFNVPIGIEITSNDYDVEVQSGRLDAGTTNVLVSSGVTGSNGKLNLTGFVMDSTKLSIPNAWVDSNHIFTYSDLGDAQNLSPIYRSWSNFEVGHANKGFDTNLGRGSEYQNGMHIITSGSSGAAIVTASAKTEGTTFSFQSLAIGEQIYLGSSQKYTNGDYLNFNAFNVTYTGSTGGTYTIEFYSGGTWVDVNYQCVHHELGHNYGNTLFGRTVASDEVIRFGMDEELTWDSTTIDGVEGKWIRITMATTPSSLPQFDLVWLDPSHTEINKNGIVNFYGNSLYRDTLVSAGNIFGLDGGVTDADILIGSTVQWTQVLESSRFNTAAAAMMMEGSGPGDSIMLQTILPKGTCTAYPLRIIIHYVLQWDDIVADPQGPLTDYPEINLKVVGKETFNNFTADPSGGILPIRRTLDSTNVLSIGGQGYSSGATGTLGGSILLGMTGTTSGGSSFSGGTSEYLSVVENLDFDISSLYESDGVFIRIEFQDSGGPSQTITFPAIEASIVKWALGERTRME